MIKETKILINIVKKASKLITNDMIVKAKDNNGDLVTNFDYEVEKYIINKLNKFFPNFDIISEEFNPLVKPKDNYFAIDPIDGTINFANNFPIWAIQIAMVKNNETISAVIYAPKLNQLYYADKDGAFCNYKKIEVTEKPVENCLYVCGRQNEVEIFKKLNISNRYLRLVHCASVSFGWTANGILGGAIFTNLNIWDYLPGLYIIKIAGGEVYEKDNLQIAGSKKLIESIKTIL